MKLEDTVSSFQRLRKEDKHGWKAAVEKGKEMERNEESLLICGYFTHASIDRERRLLDERRTKWIARRMDMITEEWKKRLQPEEVKYRVNKQAVEKKIATYSKEEIQWNEGRQVEERLLMERLLICEVNKWEQLFWNKLKSFLDQIGNGRAEEEQRLKREWRANYWKRLNSQMHAALKRWSDIENIESHHKRTLRREWESSISQLFEVVPRERNLVSLSKVRGWIEGLDDDEIGLQSRIENEIEDIEFRLKLGSDLGRFDLFCDEDSLFECTYYRSKWLYLWQNSSDFRRDSTVPLKIYARALKRNQNITHITFSQLDSDSVVNRLQAITCDLPWVTSVSRDLSMRHRFDERTLPPIHHGILFIKSTNNDLITFAKDIRLKLDPSSAYIFTDAGDFDIDSGRLEGDARVLISFVGPSGKSLRLKLKHSGVEGAPLEVTLGPTIIQLDPSSKSSLTIDDITLYPVQDPGSSKSDYPGILFEPGVWNDIIVNFRRTAKVLKGRHGHFLHDIELLDESGLEYRPRNSRPYSVYIYIFTVY